MAAKQVEMLCCAFYHPCSNLSCDKSGCCSCLVPRRLSLDENVRAKEGGKETTGETALRLPSVPFPWSLAVHHQSLAFRARLYDEKNEAPEEEAVVAGYEKLLQKVESKTVVKRTASLLNSFYSNVAKTGCTCLVPTLP